MSGAVGGAGGGGGGGAAAASASRASSSQGPSKSSGVSKGGDGGKAPASTAKPSTPATPAPEKTPASAQTQADSRQVNAANEAAVKAQTLGADYANQQAKALTIDGAKNQLQNADKTLTAAKQTVAETQARHDSVKEQAYRALGAGQSTVSQLQSAKDFQAKAEKGFADAQQRYAAAESAARFRGETVPPRPATENQWSTKPGGTIDKSGVRVGVGGQVGPYAAEISAGPKGIQPKAGLTGDFPLVTTPFGSLKATGSLDNQGARVGLEASSGPANVKLDVGTDGVNPSVGLDKPIQYGIGPPGAKIYITVQPEAHSVPLP